MTISLNPIISFTSKKLETKYQDASRYSIGASFAKATQITPFSLTSRSRIFVKERRFSHCFSVADSDQLAADASNKDLSNPETSPAKNDQLASKNPTDETVQLQAKSESKTSAAATAKSQSATARTSLKMRERIRAARVLSGYNKEPKAAKSEMGSGVLSALKESEKGKKKRSGLPEAPSNIFDDSKRGMPKEGLTFDFPGAFCVERLSRLEFALSLESAFSLATAGAALSRICSPPLHPHQKKMPSKEDSLDKDKCLDLFLKIGLDERTAKNTIANNKVTTNLASVIHEAKVTDGCSRTVGNLLYTVATKFPANALPHRPTLLQYIVSSKVKTTAQLDAALSFLATTGLENLDLNKFEEACGVGVEVSTEDIKHAVNEVFEENKASILELRYRTNVGELLGHVRKRLPWADAKAVKQMADAKLYELLGDRTAADDEKPSKIKKEKPAKVKDRATPVSTPEKAPEEDLNPYLIFPNPEENLKVHTEVPFSDGTILRCCNSKGLLDKHLKETGGKVRTRFPPEPNGYLHIGHAKAMFIDFGLAKDRDGECYLRYDDTNPEAEKKEYIDHIEEIVQWMGWKPSKITYTSNYFQDLYDLAVELIRRGHAYVDHQTPDEIKEYRENKLNSPWRDRPISESLKLFEDMRRGVFEEGKATLRMKQDMQSDNYNMYDLIAYRIKFTPHPHAGDKWCIYPSYDYAHCIVDSLENVTHSLCTLEFETRRASYYWLLHSLGIYQPYVWEYSRLNISNTVMSKRKLNRLVTENWVDGWDDPRLMTLAGLRRRGITSTAINSFVRGIGITRSDGTLISVKRLEYHVREELNRTAPRAMVVLHPLKVVITNVEANSAIEVDAKKWPDAQANDLSAFYKIPFSSVVYIDRSDFQMQDSKDYYGLAPGKSVILRYAFPIKCTEVVLADDNETILEIRAEYDPSKKTKPKGVLHWVAQPSPGVDPLKVEVRLFDKLFLSENPAELDNWLRDLNPQSKVVIPNAFGVSSLRDAKVGDSFQFERLGYFVVDRDSTSEKLVFNRTVTLKDNYRNS